MATDIVTIGTFKRSFETADKRFVITAEIQRAQIVAPYLTVDLLPADKESVSLSISGTEYERNRAGIWRDASGGQIVETFGGSFPNDPTVQRICEIWKHYHLGDMNAGTREQSSIVNEYFSRTGERYDYGKACEVLKDAGKLEVPIPDSESGPMYAPRMYRYGTAWLSDALPADIATEIIRLFSTPVKPDTDRDNERTFADRHGIAMKVERTDRNPSMPESRDMDHWKCTLIRKQPDSGRPQRMTVTFSMGLGHHGAEPTITEVLESLASDAATVDNAGSFEDFCSELGYDSDSRTAERTFKACEHIASRLKNFLGDDLYQSLLWSR
jgi:hypothetical protein